MAVAGLALGLATALPWLESEAFITEGMAEGVRLTFGLAAVVLGLALLALGLADARRAVAGRGFALAALLVSVAAFGVTLFATVAPETTIETFEAGRIATEFELEAEPVRDTIEEAFAAGTATAKPAIGLYLALAASAVALFASSWGIVAASR